MEKIDLRTVTVDVRKELKRVAIRLFKTCNNRTEVARQLGVSRVTINQWVSSYQEHGQLIEEKIIDRTSDQYKLPFALWINRTRVSNSATTKDHVLLP